LWLLATVLDCPFVGMEADIQYHAINERDPERLIDAAPMAVAALVTCRPTDQAERLFPPLPRVRLHSRVDGLKCGLVREGFSHKQCNHEGPSGIRMPAYAT
jgi:hypothetical protein